MSRLTWKSLRVLFLAAVFLLLFSQAMFRPLDHDEHQFVASAVLIAQNGLEPYQDFAFFHMPYLPLLNSIFFTAGQHYLFVARSLSVLFAFLTLLIVYFKVEALALQRPLEQRFFLAGAAVLLFLNCQLFAYTTGLTWNHDSATFFFVAAFLLFLRAIRVPEKWGAALLAGMCLSISTGLRLSFAPLFAPFFLLPFFYRKHLFKRQLWMLLSSFAAGAFLGILPAAWYFWQSPDAFLFGNLGYPELNTLYRQDIGFTRGMNIGLKFLLLGELLIQPGNLFVLITAIVFGWNRRNLKLSIARRDQAEPLFILLMMPFLLVGTFAATPTQMQYFYPVIFGITLVSIYSLLHWGLSDSFLRRKLLIFGIFLSILSLPGLSQYPNLYDLPKDHKWTPTINRRVGKEIARKLPANATVLTLAPIPVLEGGLNIYPNFASGPFAYRTAKFLDEPDRARYLFVGSMDLEAFLQNAPPDAILTGYEWRDDRGLEDYARRHQYQPGRLSNGKTLWIKP